MGMEKIIAALRYIKRFAKSGPFNPPPSDSKLKMLHLIALGCIKKDVNHFWSTELVYSLKFEDSGVGMLHDDRQSSTVILQCPYKFKECNTACSLFHYHQAKVPFSHPVHTRLKLSTQTYYLPIYVIETCQSSKPIPVRMGDKQGLHDMLNAISDNMRELSE